MKKLIYLLFSITATLSANGPACSQTKILILKAAEHPALNATEKGILEKLNPIKSQLSIQRVCSSTGPNVNTIALKNAVQPNKFKDVIVITIGTGPSVATLPYAKAKKCKMLFASVTDPIDAKLAQSIQRPGNNTSGASNFIDIKPQIDNIIKVVPTTKTIGMLYNPSEPNSIAIIKKVKKYCQMLGIKVIDQPICNTTQATPSTQKILSQGVDLVFISNDNTALSCIAQISKAAAKKSVPVFVSDTDVVSAGAVMATGPNQYALGLQVGQMAVDIIQGGRDIALMPVQFPEKVDICINSSQAKILNLSLQSLENVSDVC